ncbi:glycosyltransferase [Thalassospira sp.]|uniref:glycosyltransferase n=1 Tax=Thalassospira sp. TaxID=1912094 RepID=UPI00273599D0|nr:glycosyltransferase family 1 protein [Thalassospira sp.]MDP2696763.1 glycosyltransferase family 1 protein [Thalassospira sp.]
MLDRSIGFDPDDRTARPLGARQRGFIALAEGFAALGHRVEARRAGGADLDLNGVAWRQIDSDAAPFDGLGMDRVLAWRDPVLLAHSSIVRGAGCWLWFDGDVALLDDAGARLTMLSHKARLFFPDKRQKSAFADDLAIAARVTAPGACPAFVAAGQDHTGFAARQPVAVTVAGWQDGLVDIIATWNDHVLRGTDDTVLEVYSADLCDALAGLESPVSDAVADLVRDSLGKGVRVCKPMAEQDMATRIAGARAWLHHGKGKGKGATAHDHVGQWLCDALAAGTPVVSFGGIANDRLENGRTGYIVPDAPAYGNVVTQLLGDKTFFDSLSAAACKDVRVWQDVAADLEKF